MKSTIKLYLTLLFFTLCVFNAEAQTVEEVWEKHMKNAREWYEINEFGNALQDYLKAKETLPTDSVAYLEGALAAAYANDNATFEKLKGEFNSVFKYTSPSFHEYSEIMLQASLSNEENMTENTLKEAIRMYPNNAEIYGGPLLSMYFEQNRIEDATKLLEELVPIVENAEFAYTLGVIYQQSENIDGALEMYNKALEKDPNHLDANYNLGTIYYNKAVGEINRLNTLTLEEFETQNTTINQQTVDLLKKAKPFIDKAASGDKHATDAFEFLQTTLVLIDHVQNTMEIMASTKKQDNSVVSFNDNVNLQAREINMGTPSTPNVGAIVSTSPNASTTTQPSQANTEEITATPEKEESVADQNTTLAVPVVTPSVPTPAVAVKEEKKEAENLLPAELIMSDLQFVYDGGVTTLSKGGSGKIKLRVENWGKGTSFAPTVKLLASMSVPGLNFDRSVKLKNIEPGDGMDVEIEVSYAKPNAVSRGFKAIKAPQNKFRVMVQDSLRNRSDMQEFMLSLDQSGSDDAGAVVAKTVQKGTNYLVLIACNNYTSWTPLANAVNDAQNFKNVLLEHYHYDKENVYELYNEQVNKAEINKLVRELATKVGEEDKVLIYYSGHGYYDEFTEEGYWVPVNAAMTQDDMSQYLPNGTILKYIKALKTKHTLLISDACFSGSMFASTSRGMMYADRVESFKSRWGLSSGGLTEVSDGNAGEHSPFNLYLTKYLVNNPNEKLTISSLALYVRQSVMSNTMQEPQGKPLKNVGHEGGEFVFNLKNPQ
ncbi:caspase family protein [Flammeovirga aprica]|uniref:Tetratricopeptide repeat protein n=1 Tax=Flammeovirga aprica JL-4 TaxID=694437 RepID=A0A7X9XCM9_9BACT|nr:caspase family protein [Flammeovirga aprica]NME71804.1 tetratricopeptide repeat protein [Flammeovirga aprica JL-4]